MNRAFMKAHWRVAPLSFSHQRPWRAGSLPKKRAVKAAWRIHRFIVDERHRSSRVELVGPRSPVRQVARDGHAVVAAKVALQDELHRSIGLPNRSRQRGRTAGA